MDSGGKPFDALAAAYDRIRQRDLAAAREDATNREARRRELAPIAGELRAGDRVYSRTHNQHGTVTARPAETLFSRPALWIRLDTGVVVLAALAELVPLPSRPPAGGAGTP